MLLIIPRRPLVRDVAPDSRQHLKVFLQQLLPRRLRSAAAGWNVGITTKCPIWWNLPRSLVMPISVLSTKCVAGLPSVTIISGQMLRICSRKNGEQASTSSGRGLRFPAGRHLSTLAM